jgi:hypothetical protein
VFDGLAEIPELSIIKEFKCCVDLYSEPIALGFWGHGIRNKYASIIKRRDFILHGDDDDVYSEEAFNLMRANCVDKTTLYVAQMYGGHCGGIIPKENKIYITNIGTPCGIVPWHINSNNSVKWGNEYGGDGEFYIAAEKLASNVVFLNFVIYIITPYIINSNTK